MGRILTVVAFALALSGCALVARLHGVAPGASEVEVWLTTSDRTSLLAQQPSLHFADGEGQGAVITVDPEQRFQRMVGFGAAITDASASLIEEKLSGAQREALLAELFGPSPGINLSFTRVVIGASDFSSRHYSLDDRAMGETDPELADFAMTSETDQVLRTLRAARAVNPDLVVMATPWSAPAWMKSSQSLVSGTLREDAYAPFAAYLRRTVEAFSAAAPIAYISIQNEPDFEPADYPGMRLSAAQRARIIGDHVGPEFERAGLATKILEWDHNWDKPEQPLGVLADAAAARYVSGVAWHCYAGDVAAQTLVREEYPDKDVFFTECSGGEWSQAWPDAWVWTMKHIVIGATRNWARGVLLWNLALDETHGPHLGGCGNCRGVVTIDSASGAIARNPEYYALAHVSRFVDVGAWRIGVESSRGGIETVAFLNSDGSRILVALNDGAEPARVLVSSEGRSFGYELAAGAAVTFRWRGR